MRVLVTGFEPFGQSTVNPSQMLVEQSPDYLDKNIEIRKAILPVDKDKAPHLLLNEMKACQPDAVLAFGLASGRSKITLERVAINLMDFRIPDNAGEIASDQPIVEGGPAAYFTTLPIRSIAEALISAGIPVEISLSAGSYLCNQVFYTMMHAIAEQQLSIPAGFIHLPALPEQAAQFEKPIPSLPMEIDLQAAGIIIARLHQD
jgi:pyroglutamyl-peptidase